MMTFYLSVSLFEHLLSSLLEVRSTFVVKLLFSVGCSSLSLGILDSSPILLCLVGCRSLLHSHHCLAVCIRHFSLSSRDSTFPWDDGGLSISLGLFTDNIKHAILEGFFVFTQSVLLPNEVMQLWVETISFHALVEQTNAVFVIWVFFELQTATIFHVLLILDWITLT